MRKITEVTRRDLFNIIQAGFFKEVETLEYEPHYDQQIPSSETVKIYMPYHGRLTEIEFLDRLYHLEDMPSTDYWYIIELRETGKRMVGHFLLRR